MKSTVLAVVNIRPSVRPSDSLWYCAKNVSSYDHAISSLAGGQPYD